MKAQALLYDERMWKWAACKEHHAVEDLNAICKSLALMTATRALLTLGSI